LAILCCTDECFLDANQSFLELTGYPPEQLLKNSGKALQLWESEPDGKVPAFSKDNRLRNQPRVLRRQDGSNRQVLLSTEPISLGAIPCLLLTLEDITNQLKLEAQLRQSQKMEVIGRMAAGIAHEFNNILTVIQGDVGLLQSAGASTLDRRALLDQIMQASQRAATFTRQLLAFSRKQVLQPRVLNLSTVVQRLKKMLGRLIGEKFEIHLNCPDNLPSTLADEGGIEQVLINLVLNSRDAMPHGGKIEISTRSVAFDEETAARQNSEARAGNFICLEISDTGCGMTPQVLARIFDPFFTTKDVGKGTGLGLSTIHGIVKQHEGWVEVASEVGHGSTFKIYFPACEGLPKSEVKSQPIPLPESGKGETILVVEDEAAVREIACSALRKRGYNVLQAADGPHALEVFSESPQVIQLLLTDMVMPNGMSGGELAQNLQRRDPRLKVIYTSGYSPEILGKDSLLTLGVNFLPKPYDLQALLNAVRICLDNGNLPQCDFTLSQPQTV
jgi:PAS domain S-box-containing protein